MVKGYVIKEFEKLSGVWRLDWFGGLSINDNVRSDPKIEIAFSPILNEKEKRFNKSAVNMNDQIIIHRGIGELPLYHIGSSWKKGQMVSSLNKDVAEIEYFTIDASEHPTFVSAKNYIKDSYYNLKRFQQQNCIICPGADHKGDPIELIIPCAEIFRFYYGTSTQMAQELVYGSAWEMNKLVMFENAETKEKRTWEDQDGNLFLTLRKRIPNSDAWTVARLIGNKHALSQARKMADYLMIPPKDGSSRPIKISFPFVGISKISCQGKPVIDQTNTWRFFVLHLNTCSYPLPYQKVLLERENDGRTGTEEQGSIETNWRSPISSKPKVTSPVPINGRDEPFINSFELTLQVNLSKFIDLQNKELIIDIKAISKYRSNKLLIKGFDGIDYGTGRGTEGNSKTNRLKVNTNGDEEEIKSNIHECFEELINALYVHENNIKNYNFSWNVMDLDNRLRTKTLKLSTFPKPYKGYRSRWIYMDENDRKRRALWIEIFIYNHFYYIVELERRVSQNDEFGIYVLTRELKGLQADYAELNNIMQKWANAQDYRSNDGLVLNNKPYESWYRDSFKHQDPDTSEGLGNRLFSCIERLERKAFDNIPTPLKKNSFKVKIKVS